MRGAETITVLGRVAQADKLDDDTVAPGASHQVDGCIIWPRTSVEAGQGEIVIDGLNVFTPPMADVLASDVVVIRGTRHQVVGTPGDYRMGTQRKGLLFQTKSLRKAGS